MRRPIDITARPAAALRTLAACNSGAELAAAAAGEGISRPVVAQHSHPPSATRIPAHAPVVLVAEDNEISWTVAKALLAQRGIRSELAHNGSEAVRMAGENDYAAVLMDCEMPVLDGYQATAQIRAAQRARHLPIIAITARTLSGERERCLAAGMDDYLAKPVRAEDLAAALARWIPKQGTP